MRNDGRTLRLTLRGVEFAGSDFDDLRPAAGTPGGRLAPFTLHGGALCSCRLGVTLPVQVDDRGRPEAAELDVAVGLGGPAANGGLDEVTLGLTLQHRGRDYAGPGGTGSFEDELAGIQDALPAGLALRMCFGCRLGDYGVFGNGLFGSMLCFRDLRSEYLLVTCKRAYVPVQDRCQRVVQETSLCPAFEPRDGGDGYRGAFGGADEPSTGPRDRCPSGR